MVYNDSNWSFALAAFETVDRRFGWGIDTLHHHITDGHVAHHLFFTQIPHYNLPMATAGITSYLKEQKIDCVYKFENTFDFPYGKLDVAFDRFTCMIHQRCATPPAPCNMPLSAPVLVVRTPCEASEECVGVFGVGGLTLVRC